MNKANGDIEFPAELFKILKYDAVKVLHSICQQIWKSQLWPQDWKRCFHSNPKERQCQIMFKLLYNCTHFSCQQGNAQNPSSQALAAGTPRISRCIQAGFRKVQGTRDQIAKFHWIIEKARGFQKNIYLCFIDYAEVFDCLDHNKLENS